MFRNLSSDLNLHVFSFFSAEEVCNTKAINKSTNNVMTNSYIWKNFLKNDYCVPCLEKINYPEYEYKELTQQFLAESEKLAAYLTAVLFSLELEKRENANALQYRDII